MELATVSKANQSRLRVKVSQRDKSTETFEQDVLTGLSSNPKTLPPKYFYDETGSRLFEEICELPEYYPTRTEDAIIKEYADEIADMNGDNVVLVELGSGSSTKTQRLIEAFIDRQKKLHYIPIDISKSMLVRSAKSLLKKYKHLRVTALAADYTTALKALEKNNFNKKLILFLGSTIGNFEENERTDFLKATREAMNDEDRLLLGTDLIKEKEILEPAYDDAQGVTAEFNLNLLTRINRELDGEFDPKKFKHKAFLNEEKSRIELHLESKESQTVKIGQLNRSFEFEKHETIHTENSHKFSADQIEKMAEASDFKVRDSWFDDKKWFSLNLLQPV